MSSPLLKPRWLVGHVLVVGLSIGFVLLGFWQLGRHSEQRDDNRVVEARLAADPTTLGEATADSDPALRKVLVTGRYDFGKQLELRPRAQNGRAGYEQIVPFDAGSDLLLVNRGFIEDAAGSARLNPGADIDITLTATVRLSQGTSRFGPQNPDTGALETIARIDIDRLSPQFGGLAGVYLDLISEQPDPGGLPTVVPTPPSASSRPHFLYTLQWWAFAAIAAVGWPFVLRKQFFTP